MPRQPPAVIAPADRRDDFLQLVDIDLHHVGLALRPFALHETDDAARDFDKALKKDHCTRYGDDRLERIDRRPLGGYVRMFLDRP